jgi:hypothetical protein
MSCCDHKLDFSFDYFRPAAVDLMLPSSIPLAWKGMLIAKAYGVQCLNLKATWLCSKYADKESTWLIGGIEAKTSPA